MVALYVTTFAATLAEDVSANSQRVLQLLALKQAEMVAL